MSITQVMASREQYANIVERDQAIAELNRAQNGVTVCIPTHNDADVLQIALESVLGQTVPPFEVIVVDDGADNEVQLLIDEKHPDQYPHIDVRVVRITNRGLPAARNTGLMLARGSAFLPLDADDWLDEHYIEKTLPLLVDADVVLVGLQEHGPTRNGTYMPGYDRPFDQVDEEILWQYNRFFYCSLFRTKTLREIGGYHSAMAGWPGVYGGYEDWDVWIDLKRRETRFAAINEVLFHYTTKPDSMLTRAETNREALVSEMRRHHRC